jgi:anti-sigma factor RsiW
MDCRTFHRKHLAYVDDTLPGIDVVAMRRHVRECERCARHDAKIRRALLLARNLPMIQPSADFQARLQARLQREKAMAALTPAHMPYAHGPGMRSFFAVAASVVAVGYLALALLARFDPPREIALAPVVATEPEPTFIENVAPPLPLATPALVTSVSAGVPVWPVMFLADQAPVHFATEQFQR